MGGARLLGIDIGTTGVRAAIFDADGTLVAEASLPCVHDAPAPGWAEMNPERWWRVTALALAQLAAHAPGGSLASVTAIAVVGQAPTVVLVDEAGGALGPAILWLDTRATREAEELGVHAYYLGPKLAWLARNGAVAASPDSARGRAEAAWHLPDPQVLGRARWILQSHAFVAYRLTGEAAIDRSTAALCLPLFDLEKLAWSAEGCARVGVKLEQLPPVRAAHDVIGHVTAAAAEAIGHGLRVGTPVVAGGGDFAAAALGAGVLDEGEACLMLGTAGNLLVPRRTPGRDPRLINAHHVGADVWLSLGGTLSGGAQEWLRYALTRAALGEDSAVHGALPAFDQLDAEAESLPAGSDGLLFLPYLQGERTPIWDTSARGAYVGLGLQHGRGHLWRAVLEGIALGFADCQDVLEHDNVHITGIVAANGGGRSALFRQILCDALGVPLTYTPESGGTVAGAAILAALGTEGLRSIADARTWRGSSVRHDPNSKVRQRYRELLALRRQTYASLKPTFEGLAAYRGAALP